MPASRPGPGSESAQTGGRSGRRAQDGPTRSQLPKERMRPFKTTGHLRLFEEGRLFAGFRRCCGFSFGFQNVIQLRRRRSPQHRRLQTTRKTSVSKRQCCRRPLQQTSSSVDSPSSSPFCCLGGVCTLACEKRPKYVMAAPTAAPISPTAAFVRNEDDIVVWPGIGGRASGTEACGE